MCNNCQSQSSKFPTLGLRRSRPGGYCTNYSGSIRPTGSDGSKYFHVVVDSFIGFGIVTGASHVDMRNKKKPLPLLHTHILVVV